MRAVGIALVLVLGIQGITTACKQNVDEYDADQKAYQECIENEPSIDDCVYNYVNYLPEDIKKEMN